MIHRHGGLGEPFPEVRITVPGWVSAFVDRKRVLPSDEDRMQLAINLAHENIRRGTGGPFGAVVTTTAGKLVGVGVNGVTRLLNSTAHAEMVAIQIAQRPFHAYSLRDQEGGSFELVSSCEPCAMCLGATLWSGVSRLVTGAQREDAEALGFDEGPVFESSYEYLVSRGITVRRGVMREEAREVLEEYRALGGPIY